MWGGGGGLGVEGEVGVGMRGSRCGGWSRCVGSDASVWELL